MSWRLVSIAAVAVSLSACGAASEAVGPLRPRILDPISPPTAAPEVNDPAPFVRGTMRPYQVRGRSYTPVVDEDYDRTGIASWYGDAFNGRPTATGEIFDMNALTAAHTTFPLPSLAEVTNLETGERIVVRVNDRGPFVDDRLIDLSRGAADALGLRSRGLGQVRVRYLGPAPRLGGGGQTLQTASRETPPPVQPSLEEAYFIQAGTFADRDNADALRRQIGRGSETRIDPVQSGGRTLYRVLVGPWNGRGEAERRRSALAGQGLYDAILVRAD